MNLFRGTRVKDGMKVVVKAVHIYSREYDIIRTLSRGPQRGDPRNHTIRVYFWTKNEQSGWSLICVGTLPAVVDLIELVVDDIAFIVMEAWSSQLITGDGPCCLGLFFATLRQCIEVGRSPSSSMCRSLQIKSTAARCLHA